jgi:hypothetical protein
MWWNRLLPALVLTLTAALLTGILPLSREPARPGPAGLSFEELRGLRPDPEAQGWFDRAVEALAPNRVAWVQTNLRQRVRLVDLSYQAEGRLLLAPEGRFRLELSMQAGSPGGGRPVARLQVSDGTNLWTARRGDDGGWIEVSHRVPGVPPEEPDRPARETSDLLSEATVPGVASLLANLRDRVRWVSQERVSGGREVRLTGVLSRGAKKTGTGSKSGTPNDRMRICRLMLEPATLWPGRVEWYGPAGDPNKDALLVEMEFRDPVLNRPLPPEVCAREFSLRAGNTIVTDLAVPPP